MQPLVTLPGLISCTSRGPEAEPLVDIFLKPGPVPAYVRLPFRAIEPRLAQLHQLHYC